MKNIFIGSQFDFRDIQGQVVDLYFSENYNDNAYLVRRGDGSEVEVPCKWLFDEGYFDQ